MTTTDELLANNANYAKSFDGSLAVRPSLQLAVVACMDARINVYGVLGLHEGEAHVIRNPGGVITEAEIRSLAISQRLLGTQEIILIHHTDCGMSGFSEEEFKASVAEDTGLQPSWTGAAFIDEYEDVVESMKRIKDSAFIPHTDQVRGFVFNVATGVLEEVTAS